MVLKRIFPSCFKFQFYIISWLNRKYVCIESFKSMQVVLHISLYVWIKVKYYHELELIPPIYQFSWVKDEYYHAFSVARHRLLVTFQHLSVFVWKRDTRSKNDKWLPSWSEEIRISVCKEEQIHHQFLKYSCLWQSIDRTWGTRKH